MNAPFPLAPPLSSTTHLDLNLSPVIVDGNGLDGAGAVRGGTLGAEVILVCTCDPLGLEPPPTGGVVGDGTTLSTLEQYVTPVVCRGGEGGGVVTRATGVRQVVCNN